MKDVVTPSGIRWQMLHVGDRRAAIRKGWEDYQMHQWQKDPPYPMDDPRRWLWQNGAEAAERYRRGDPAMRLETIEGWWAHE